MQWEGKNLQSKRKFPWKIYTKISQDIKTDSHKKSCAMRRKKFPINKKFSMENLYKNISEHKNQSSQEIICHWKEKISMEDLYKNISRHKELIVRFQFKRNFWKNIS